MTRMARIVRIVRPLSLWCAGLLLPLALLYALTVGRYPLAAGEVVRFLLASAGLQEMALDRYDSLYNLIVEIRLPRLLAAVLIGAALACAGAAYQAVFRNPLVSPGLLGVLSGASFGAALGMLLQLQWLGVQMLAFGFGVLAVAFGVLVAVLFGRMSIIMLVLGGVISSGLFAALLAIVKYLADPQNDLPGIVYWQMGSLAKAQLGQTLWLVLPMGLGIVLLTGLGRALDALSMGDEEARALGVPVHWVRGLVIVAATLLSALTVSVAGTIGWVGLIVPHVARMLAGPANPVLLPLSALLGAVFLLVCDTAARSLSGVEIPIGIMTELVGIPVFLLVLHRVRKGWM